MMFKTHLIIDKFRGHGRRERDVDRYTHVPAEIFIPERIVNACSLQHQHSKLQHATSKSSMSQSTYASWSSSDNSAEERLSRESAGIRDDLCNLKQMADTSSLRHQHEKFQYATKNSSIKRSRRVKQNLQQKTSSSSTGSQDNSSDERLSEDSTGIRNEDLWKGATTYTNNGTIKEIDKLCSYSVVQMMSRNDIARKKLLDNILNRGEF